MSPLRRCLPWQRPAEAGPSVPDKPPWGVQYRSSTYFIVGCVCFAIFTDIFLYGLIVPVMPYALTERAGIPHDDLQRWNTILVATYGIALFVGSPIAGVYADHTSSRRWPLLLGLIALGASTVLLCVGRSIGVFIAGRVLQGFSAAVVWSVGLALLADTMGRRIGLAMGYVAISLSGGLLFAPLIGGAVYAGSGYYAVYYVAFGLIVLDILLRLLLIEKKIACRWLKAEACTADAPVDLPRPPTADEEAAGGAAGATPAVAHASRVVSHVSDTGLPPTPPEKSTFQRICILLRSRRLIFALLGVLIDAGIMTAYDTVLPLYVQETFNWSSTAAGLIFFALFIPPLVLSPPVGVLADRWGAKWLSLVGFVALVPLLVCLRFVDHNTYQQKVLLGVLLSLTGVALTFSNVPIMAEISFTIEAEEERSPGVWGSKGVYGVGYGLFNTAFALGSAGGSLIAGYIHADYSWATMAWVVSIWCGVGALSVAFGVGEFRVGPPAKPKHNSAMDAGAVLADAPATSEKTTGGPVSAPAQTFGAEIDTENHSSGTAAAVTGTK
ncbi:MFS transporter [Sporothrix schenckii 1099-18]|uniref:Major facilitator superfamily (MFS) profile domain-containing protein n=2 Tax=Sporothrix schenckii TaxID=29908 RepID=U7Q5G0_SPOS1|nr:MFS transporter [Sporothrix schenckii 1099-18]ERT02275.1 hypothetical protein HMPREF1624_00573 [Sporothrix schenckii ATCC 58251]KJR80485.1 MFS transporter [Sporothrix schenckii 1099-18]